MTYVKLVSRIRRIMCMNVDHSVGGEKINDSKDIFLNLCDSDKVQISLCFPPFDLICEDSFISSQSNGFKITKNDNKILFSFDDINSLNSFCLLIRTEELDIKSNNDFQTIEFVDSKNETVYKLPVIFLIDSNGRLFLDCKYKIIRRDDNCYLFGFELDDEIFKKNISFPITIDPIVTFSSSYVTLKGIIYNTNTNYGEDFSSYMVGGSQQYLFGTEIKIKIKEFFKERKIYKDNINSFILKVSGSNSAIKHINIVDENNKAITVNKNNNIYQIDLKKYISENFDDISILLNYYDSEEFEEIKYEDINLDYKENIISSLYIKNPPYKTVYEYGESFDSTGLIVVAVYSNSDEKEINDYSISNEILKRNIKQITISYKGVYCYQDIEVFSKPVSLVLKTDERFKSTYLFNENPSLFGVSGIVTFEDGIKENTSNLKIKNQNSFKELGEQKLDILYVDSHFNITLSNSIKVKVNAFDSLYRGKSIDNYGLNLYDLSFHQKFCLNSIPGFFISVSLVYDSLLPTYLKVINDVLPSDYFLSCCLFLYQEEDKSFKYIDENGFIHTFEYIKDSNVLFDNDNCGLLFYIDENCIKDRKGTCIYFLTDGRVDYILFGKYSNERINYFYDSDRKLIKIASDSNSLTYFSFNYDFENYLNKIDAYLNGEKVDCAFLNYKKIRVIYLENRREAYLSTIEKVDILTESKTKVLEVIYNSLTQFNLDFIGFNYISSHSAIRIEKDNLYNLNHDCISSFSFGRLDESNSYIVEEDYEMSYIGYTLDDFRHICEVIITDKKKNIKTSYMISNDGEIISNLGCKRHGIYLTLSPEYGYKLKLDGNGESINNRKSTNFVSSIKLTEFENESVSNIESRCLSIWLMLAERCNIAYLCSKDDVSRIEINSNNLNAWQKVNITIREDKLPIELFVKNEKDKVIKAKYADPIITHQKEGKIQISSLSGLKIVDFENFNIIINGNNYYHSFTVSDFISTFIEYGFYSRQDASGNYLDNPSISLYGNKKRINFNDDIVLIDKNSNRYKLLELIKNSMIIFNEFYNNLNSLYAFSLNFENDLLKVVTQVTKYNYLNEKYLITDTKYYDAFGFLIKEEDEKGVITYYEYDDNFNSIKSYRKNGDSQLVLNENVYDEYNNLTIEKNNYLQRKYIYDKGLLKEENVSGLNDSNNIQLKFEYQYDGYSRLNKYSKKSENETLDSNVIYSNFDLKELNDKKDRINFISDYKNNVSTLLINSRKIKYVEYVQDGVIYHYSNSDIPYSYLYDNYGKLISILKNSVSYVSFEYENNECDKSSYNLSRIDDTSIQRSTEFFYDESGDLKEKIIVENNDEIYKKIINSNNIVYKYSGSYIFGKSVFNQESSIFTFYFKNECVFHNLIIKIEEKYDSLNRLVDICQMIEGLLDCTISYHSNSLLPRIIFYKEFNSCFKNEYDSIGRIEKTFNRINDISCTENIEYDEIGRLKSFKRNGSSVTDLFQHIYSYDGSKLSYIYNPINYETRNFYYDSNGY